MRGGRIRDEYIHIPVVVAVAEYRAVADALNQHPRPTVLGHLGERTVAPVAEELVALRIRGGRIVLFHVLIEMSIADEHVEEPVVVVIEKGGRHA